MIVITGAALTAAVLVVAKRPILGIIRKTCRWHWLPQTAAVIAVFHLCDAMQCINTYLLRAYKVAVVPLILQILALTGMAWWAGGWSSGRAGALAPMLRLIAPGPTAPAQCGPWPDGPGAVATLLFGWYQYIVRRHRAI